MKKSKKSDKKQRKENKRSWGWLAKLGIFVFSFILSTGILIFERSRGADDSQFQIGNPAPRTIFAPFELTYIDQLATDSIKESKRKQVAPVYKIDKTVVDEAINEVGLYFTALSTLKAKTPEGERPSFENLPLSVSDFSTKYFYESKNLDDFLKTIVLLLEQTYEEGLISEEQRVGFWSNNIEAVTVFSPKSKEERAVLTKDLKLIQNADVYAVSLLPGSIAKNRKDRDVILEIFENVVTKPNLVFDAERTAAKKTSVAAAVTPIEDVIKKEELIIQRGRIISAEEKQRIDAIYQKLREEKRMDKLYGISLLIFIAYILCFFFLFYFEPKILKSTQLTLLVHSVFVLVLGISKIVIAWPGSSAYLMPTALASLLLTLLVSVRLGVIAACMMTVFAAALTGFQADVILATLTSGLAGTFASLRLRKRSEFLKIGAAVGCSYFAVLYAFQIYLEYGAMESFQISALGLANGLLITIPICFLILPFLEVIFDLTTDITLLELSDLNHPLLKRMVVEAPGTYHHSLVVSTLAESACEKIGANALLARVGCYFHDIGKIARAEYFTENQRQNLGNKHDQMSPSMSAFTIMDHVKGGIELGKHHKLKKRILDFIPEHHGTQVIYYFYRKALDNAKPGEKVNVDDFRYSGPKPQSRETAVTLLADSTEAASRSLKNPTPEAIQQLVRKIINDKFIDGQLDECDLTLRDLHHIQDSFVRNLMAIYHTRVSYPVKPEDPTKPDLFKDAKSVENPTDHADGCC